VKAILGCGALLDQTLAVRDEGSELSDMVRRDPDGRQSIHSQQAGQNQSVDLVRLHHRSSNQLDVIGMDNPHVVHQGLQQIMDEPGVRARL
jgi:hypothetical protein